MGKNDLAARGGNILIYQTEQGRTKIEVRLEGETLWLNQADLARLYQTTIPNINIHIKNIYDEEELSQESTIKDYLIVQTEGNRQISRQVKHYNLDIIISVGYRIKSSALYFKIA
ncbi:MAG: RhuM family protein [Phycisphaerae bacterium]